MAASPSPNCPHFSRARDKGQGTCGLGLYGGKPWPGNCLACITAGENNAAFAKELFARAERTHPAGVTLHECGC